MKKAFRKVVAIIGSIICIMSFCGSSLAMDGPLHTAESSKTITYPITYIAKDGNTCTGCKYLYIEANENPLRNECSFYRWNMDSGFTEYVKQIKTEGILSSVVLNSKQTTNKYNIEFDGNGATSGDMSTMTGLKCDKSYTLKANTFKKQGYIFVCWNTEMDGSGEEYADKASVKNLTTQNDDTITLYAQWIKKQYKVAMICDSVIDDGGWGTRCYQALVDAAGRQDWEYEVTDGISNSAYYKSMATYCALGYDLIIAPGIQYTDAVLRIAKKYPNISLAILNGSEATPAKAKKKNVISLLPDATQIGWIAGTLASLMTESGTIAFIGGKEQDTTKAKYAGYGEAAKYIGEKEGKDIKLLDIVYANSFSDSGKGIELANAFMDQGADVFFGDASTIDAGVRYAIDEYNQKQGAIKVYDIAQPEDFLGQNACIIGSQITDISYLMELALKSVMEGKLGGEVLYGNLQNGVLSVGKLNNLIPKEIQDKYFKYIDEMTKGTFGE